MTAQPEHSTDEAIDRFNEAVSDADVTPNQILAELVEGKVVMSLEGLEHLTSELKTTRDNLLLANTYHRALGRECLQFQAKVIRLKAILREAGIDDVSD